MAAEKGEGAGHGADRAMMRARLCWGAAATALLVCPVPAAAEEIEPVVCPVGGEEFLAPVLEPQESWGARPDGKPYGSGAWPQPLVRCPANGLVLFDDFSEAELARLETLIAAPDYAEIVRSRTSYYAAYWLARALDRPLARQAALLLQATWQVNYPPPARQALLGEYLAFIDGPFRAAPAATQLAYRAYAVNAERERGEWLAAETRLAALRKDLAGELGAAIAETDRKGMLSYLDGLAAVIARHEAKSEPLDLIPDPTAVSNCVIYAATLDAWEQAYCTAPERAEAVEAARADMGGAVAEGEEP